MINLDLSRAVSQAELRQYESVVNEIHEMIINKNGRGSDFLGWIDWPLNYDKDEFAQVKKVAKDIRDNADVLLVCGIGGSYLGSRSAIEWLKGLYSDDHLEIIFVGNSFSANYLNQVIDHIKDKSIYLNVISKSGTTTETALAFRILEDLVIARYGVQQSKRRIIATTDANKGTLKTLADLKGYQTFTIPDDIGGRYSVLTSVGLLPIAAAGIDIDQVMAGALKAMIDLKERDLNKNLAYQYGVARRIIEKRGKSAEMLVTYEPQMVMIGEWWKQLFGESEGKEGKGLLPTSCCFSTDLHSMGQFIQEGTKCLFETILLVEKPLSDIVIKVNQENLDNMNYLAGKT
ncbi:MAG: glucose-6-phosphate isomerase, partial [Erysipelotrichaceae bacterium]|nr:glucose-6-phosphate isomerase [Erysipelotrichaceae bacterium]